MKDWSTRQCKVWTYKKGQSEGQTNNVTKTLHIILKIEQHEPHWKRGWKNIGWQQTSKLQLNISSATKHITSN